MEKTEAYWQGESTVNSFNFDDDHCEIVNVENIEQEKQKAINSPAASSAASKSQPVLRPNVVQLNASQYSQFCREESVSDEPNPLELSPAETIRRMVLGKTYILEPFKAMYQKQELLSEASAWHDGNAILAVILFLKRTLCQNLFFKIIMERKTSLDHYLKYLKMTRDHSTLNDILVMLGRTEDAFMSSYELAIASQHPETKLNRLRKFANTRMNNPGLEFLESHVMKQVMLLECQLPIEEEDAKNQKEGRNLIFQTVPRPLLPNLTVIDTLHYCCLYHFYLTENKFASPLYIKKSHQLSEKQFVWTALRAFTRLELWKDVDVLFQSKSWLGTNTTKSVIGFESVVIALHKANAPIEMITKYMYLVETVEKRLNLAKRLKYHQIAVDTFVSMRDRVGLEVYRAELVPNSMEHKYCNESLRASSIKWKN